MSFTLCLAVPDVRSFVIRRITRCCLVVCLPFLISVSLHAQKKHQNPEAAIRAVLSRQQIAWNRGDLAGFMQGYWQSDSLRFVSTRGLTHGWAATLAGYQKGYPNTEAMGQLTFTVLRTEKLSKRSAYMIGKWHLARTIGDVGGHFMLIWKKINGEWVIVADHTS